MYHANLFIRFAAVGYYFALHALIHCQKCLKDLKLVDSVFIGEDEEVFLLLFS
jgi:hypothetical protein